MNKRIEKVRQEIISKNIDGVIITSPENVKYLSGISDFYDNSISILMTADTQKLIMPQRFFDKGMINKEYELIEYKKGYFNGLAEIIESLKMKRIGFEDQKVLYKDYLNFQEKVKIDMVPLGHFVDSLRVEKDQEEIDCIKKASDIACESFQELLDIVKPGISEKDLALELEYTMRKKGAEGIAFDTIITSGKRCAIPHAVTSNKKIENNEFLLIDFGCTVNGYCTDMTRTIALGKVSDKHKKVYDTVLNAQVRACNFIREGVTAGEADSVARNYIEENGYKDKFSHSLGHGVGIKVHEYPVLSPKSDIKLINNMIITVEPGIYIEDFCGVRIEDTVVVKKDGIEILTNIPKDLIII